MSTIQNRAITLYRLALALPETEAVAEIEAALRRTRHEGINRGVDLCELYGHQLERKSA